MNEAVWPLHQTSNSQHYLTCEQPSVLVRQAVIIAGGKGTRLHPYSVLFPKPLMPLGDMPVLELLLRRMKAGGVQEVIIAVNHLRHLIEAYFGDGSAIGLRLRYSNEENPWGLRARSAICSTFLTKHSSWPTAICSPRWTSDAWPLHTFRARRRFHRHLRAGEQD